jgi:hypothetical protein
MSIVEIDKQEFRINQGLLRILSLREDLLDKVEDPYAVVDLCRKNHVPADILTFTQHLPDLSPKFEFHMEWDNIAAIPISTYENWLYRQVHQNTRKRIRKAHKSGVNIEVRDFNETLIRGLVDIFNETPVRRGRRFPYFGKTEADVENEWSPDLERSEFIVADYNEEIIGFIKFLYCESYARASGTLTKLSHRDKSPMNALIAKAVEICVEKKIPYLIYGKYVYGKKGEDGLTDFKRHNGFQRINVPRYYIPLSLRGTIGLKLGLHHGILTLLPSGVLRELSAIRSLWYKMKLLSH